MQPRCATTGYARYSAGSARALLVIWLLAAALGVALTLSPLAWGNADKSRPGPSDVDLYGAEVQRIHAGQGYYEAAAAELHQRGYPTRSVFNWRTPLPMWLIGHLPNPLWGKALLGLLALVLLALAFEAIGREQPGAIGRPLACVLLLSGPLMFCVLDDLYVMPVLWAGVLIALSITFYGLDRPAWGVGCGLAAVCFRELALPYCLLALGLAWWTGKRRESLLWLAGLAAWAVFFAIHGLRVWELIQPSGSRRCTPWRRCADLPAGTRRWVAGSAGPPVCTSSCSAWSANSSTSTGARWWRRSGVLAWCVFPHRCEICATRL
jgi:hypothetical protein